MAARELECCEEKVKDPNNEGGTNSIPLAYILTYETSSVSSNNYFLRGVY